MSKLSGVVKTFFWIKSSIIAAALGAYMLYDNLQPVKELEYNLFEKNQKVEQGYFQDPPGLKTTWRPNQNGNMESFIQYESGGIVHKEVPIMSDLLPPTETMLKGIQKRVNLEGVLLEIKDNQLYGTFTDSSGTYTRKVDPSLFKNQESGYQKASEQRALDSLFSTIKNYIGGE